MIFFISCCTSPAPGEDQSFKCWTRSTFKSSWLCMTSQRGDFPCMVLFGREIKCFQVLKMLLVAPLKTLGCYTLTNVSLTSACDLIFKSPDTFFCFFSWFLFCFCSFFPWKRTLDQQKHLVFFSLQTELNFWSQSTEENERFPEMFDLNCRSLFLNPIDWLC